MAKFYGVIGYAGSVEVESGVWQDVIIERQHYGDVLRNSRSLRESSEKVNDNISVGNSISIVADAYANTHFFAMKFVEWQGTLWKVDNVDVKSPRLILRLGGVYTGERQIPQEGPSDDSGEPSP